MAQSHDQRGVRAILQFQEARNGVIVLDEPVALHERTEVRVEVAAATELGGSGPIGTGEEAW
jgi:hypothetical protein